MVSSAEAGAQCALQKRQPVRPATRCRTSLRHFRRDVKHSWGRSRSGGREGEGNARRKASSGSWNAAPGSVCRSDGGESTSRRASYVSPSATCLALADCAAMPLDCISTDGGLLSLIPSLHDHRRPPPPYSRAARSAVAQPERRQVAGRQVHPLSLRAVGGVAGSGWKGRRGRRGQVRRWSRNVSRASCELGAWRVCGGAPADARCRTPLRPLSLRFGLLEWGPGPACAGHDSRVFAPTDARADAVDVDPAVQV
ncbi:hypothetical protein B0H17DRAFT_125893 [Mycena rosella]|uniref:Uncharacterized protein n=1 Tax=Mycena rosella TaxID=1033263 RepID=A0AAD7D6S8_MYCRO|nr:hypothetical protein B0H17DRAFT_125893 [Mycena rosella]